MMTMANGNRDNKSEWSSQKSKRLSIYSKCSQKFQESLALNSAVNSTLHLITSTSTSSPGACVAMCRRERQPEHEVHIMHQQHEQEQHQQQQQLHNKIYQRLTGTLSVDPMRSVRISRSGKKDKTSEQRNEFAKLSSLADRQQAAGARSRPKMWFVSGALRAAHLWALLAALLLAASSLAVMGARRDSSPATSAALWLESRQAANQQDQGERTGLQLLQRSANVELSRRSQRLQRDAVVSPATGSDLAGATCGYPGSPAHASVTFNSSHVVAGTAASYACDNGYELLGPPRRICQANGTWSPVGIPFCGKFIT